MRRELAEQQLRRVVVRENGDGPYGQTCIVRAHAFAADKPAASGGSDTGPDPFELLMTSLAACTAMTLRMYAQRKALNVGRITVIVEQDRNFVESRSFRRLIEVVPPVCERIAGKLVDIANKCPVHKLLASGTAIDTLIDP